MTAHKSGGKGGRTLTPASSSPLLSSLSLILSPPFLSPSFPYLLIRFPSSSPLPPSLSLAFPYLLILSLPSSSISGQYLTLPLGLHRTWRYSISYSSILRGLFSLSLSFSLPSSFSLPLPCFPQTSISRQTDETVNRYLLRLERSIDK